MAEFNGTAESGSLHVFQIRVSFCQVRRTREVTPF